MTYTFLRAIWGALLRENLPTQQALSIIHDLGYSTTIYYLYGSVHITITLMCAEIKLYRAPTGIHSLCYDSYSLVIIAIMRK